jgi:hypothetical protein
MQVSDICLTARARMRPPGVAFVKIDQFDASRTPENWAEQNGQTVQILAM